MLSETCGVERGDMFGDRMRKKKDLRERASRRSFRSISRHGVVYGFVRGALRVDHIDDIACGTALFVRDVEHGIVPVELGRLPAVQIEGDLAAELFHQLRFLSERKPV